MTKKKSASVSIDIGRENNSNEKYTHRIKNQPQKTIRNHTIYKNSKNHKMSKQNRKRLKLQSLLKSNSKNQKQTQPESFLINCFKSIKNPIKNMLQKKESSKSQVYDRNPQISKNIFERPQKPSKKIKVEKTRNDSSQRLIYTRNRSENKEKRDLSKQNQEISQKNTINKEPPNQQVQKITQPATVPDKIILESYPQNEKSTSTKNENVFLGPIVKEQKSEKKSIQKMQDQILDIINQLENQLKESALQMNNFYNQELTEKNKNKETHKETKNQTQREKYKQKEEEQRKNKIGNQKQKVVSKEKSTNNIYMLFQNQLNQKLKKTQEMQSIQCESTSEERKNEQKKYQRQNIQYKNIKRIYIPKLQILERTDTQNNDRKKQIDTEFTLALRKITEKSPRRSVNCDRQRKKYLKKKYFIEISLFNENIEIFPPQDKKVKAQQSAFKRKQKESLYKVNYYLPPYQTDLETRYTLITNTNNIPGLKLVKTEFMLKWKLLKYHPKEFVEYLEFSLMKIKKGKQGGQNDPIILQNKILLEETMMTMVSSNLETSLDGNKICKFQAKNYSRKLRSYSKRQHIEQNAENSKQIYKEEIEF